MRRIILNILVIIFILVLIAVGTETLGFHNGRLTWQLPGAVSSLHISGPATGPNTAAGTTRVVTEESVTIDVVKKVTPSVVTVGITTTQPTFQSPDFGSFGSLFLQPDIQQGPSQQIKQDIGSGFILQSGGLIATNKHVVSDTTAKYRVITADNKSYDVQKIYRDPNNDLAILKINATNLPPIEIGDSSNLQVGQFAIAIGTALGEFRSTVTTGVISGLGRGITAGSPLSGSEELTNVIQTSAPINPGNSGGPLLNSSGQVIGVNVAVAQDAQNIGFALPINVVKSDIQTFETAGGFPARAYLGVQYGMVTQDLSILNEIPEGAYVESVVSGSPADTAGVQQGDIITKVDGQNIRDATGGLAAAIAKDKPGQTVQLTIYRGTNQTVTVKATLTEASQ